MLPPGQYSGDVIVTVTVDDGSMSITDDLVVTVLPVNDAPTLTPATVDLTTAEDSLIIDIPDITAGDVDGDPLAQQWVLTISLPDSQGTFSTLSSSNINFLSTTLNISEINTTLGNLQFTPAENYNGEAVLSVAVADQAGAQALGTVTIDVTAVNDLPLLTGDTAFSMDENTSVVLGSPTASDADGEELTLTVTLGDTNFGLLYMGDEQGREMELTGAPDELNDMLTSLVFEPQNDFYGVVDIVYLLSDSEAFDSFTLNVSIVSDGLEAVNDPPSLSLENVTATIVENVTGGMVIADIVVDDDVLGTNSLQLSGDDAALFEIANSQLKLSSLAVLDFETQSSLSVTVEIDDADVGTSPDDFQALTISVIDVNEAPQLDNAVFTLDENLAGGSLVDTVSASDPDAGDTHSYAVVGGTGQNAFEIDPAAGAIRVLDTTLLDYETTAQFDLTVEVTDSGGLSGQATVTLNLADVNEAPVIAAQTFSIQENVAAGALVGLVTADDEDAGDPQLSFAIVPGLDSAAVTINAASGEIHVADSSAFDFESDRYVNLNVRVTDGGGLSSTAAVTVNLTNVNESPGIRDAQYMIAENLAVGTPLGTPVASDPDSAAGDTLSYAIVGGSGDGIFAVDPSTGEISVADSASLDYETETQFDLQVRVTDGGGLSDESTVAVFLADVNDVTPVVTADQNLSVGENSANGTAVGTLLATDADVTPTTFESWTITGGTGAAVFALDSDTGQLTVADSSRLDRETIPSFTLQVTVSDGVNTSAGETVAITLDDVNEFAPALADATFTVDENSANATWVGTLTATDADATNTGFSYQISAGNDLGGFTIDNNGRITVADSSRLDFESTPSFPLEVTVSDGGLSGTATVTINLNDVAETPTADAGGPYLISEGSNLDLSGAGSDPDGDAALLSYTWDLNNDGTFGDATGAAPTVTWAALQALSPAINDDGAYTIRLRVTDPSGLTADSEATLSIINTVPIVSISGPSEAVRGEPLSFALAVDEPSAADAAAGFDFVIDWGDNHQTLINGALSPLDVEYTYMQKGDMTIQVTATDKDGGVSITATHQVTVAKTKMKDGKLLVGGSTSDDTISLFPGSVYVTFDSEPALGPFEPTAGIVVFGLSGDDTISVDPDITLPLEIFGGPGNDVLVGGGGPNALYGQAGNDELTGGPDVNLLDGGGDDDLIHGGGVGSSNTIIGGAGSNTFVDGGGVNSIDPTPGATAPEVFTDPYEMFEGGVLAVPAGGGVLSNDVPFSTGPLEAVLVAGPTGGQLSLNPDGSFQYIPDAGFQGTDTFSYLASEGTADSSAAVVAIDVKNADPIADAGADRTVAEGTLVILDGQYSDPGSNDTHTFLWQVSADNGQEIADGTAEDFSFTPFDNGLYTLTYMVTDNDGAAASDDVVITVNNAAPTAEAGADRTVDEGTLVNLDGQYSDPGSNDTHTFLWQVAADNGQEIADGTAEDFSFTPYDNGVYTLTYTVSDDDGAAASDEVVITVGNTGPDVTVDVATQTVQYSDALDPVTISATDIAEDTMNASVSWSDGGAFQAGLPDALTIAGGLTFQGDTDQVGTGTWTISGIADLDPSRDYTLRVTVTDEDGGSGTEDIVLLVDPEDARSTYAGQYFVSTPSIRSSEATIELRATVVDITTAVDSSHAEWDDEAGQISQARVTFVDASGDPIAADAVRLPVTLVDPADPSAAVAAYSWAVDIGNQDSISYDVGIRVEDFYERFESTDLTVVTVSKPQDNSVTGGGFIVNTDSDGRYAGDDDLHTNFGFNIKFNKKLTNVQGKVNVILRQGDRVYQVKSNATDTLLLDPNDHTRAEFRAKANLTDITDPLNPVSLGGNLTFIATVTDSAGQEGEDQVGFTLWNGDELWYSSRWNGTNTEEQSLRGGNVRVKTKYSPANVAPVLGAIGSRQIENQATLIFTATATDQDLPADTLTYGLDTTSLAAGMTIDGDSGAFEWTPDESQDGATYSVTLTVTDDGEGALSDAETFDITVVDEVEPNLAPVLGTIGNRIIDEQATLTFTATATDPNLPAQTLTYSLDTASLAAGMTINPDSGVFAWTPDESQGGASYSVTLTVTDDGEGALSDSENFDITVNEVNVAPVLDSIGNQAIDEQATLTFTAAATDQDLPADTLTFSLDSNSLAAGMTIDAATGEFSWTPVESQGGSTYPVTLAVTDDGTGTLSVSETFIITVNQENLPPTVTAIGDQTIDEDSATGLLTFTINDAETDAGLLTVTAGSSDPSLIPDGNLVLGGSGADRTIAVTPAADRNGGPATITLSVFDGFNTTETSFDVTVNAVNDPALISGTAGGALTEDDAATSVGHTLSVSDPDPGEDVFQAAAAADLAGSYGDFTFSDATGAWTYILDNTRLATDGLSAGQEVHDQLTVTSADGTDSETIIVTITGTNDAAVLSAATANLTEADTAAAISTAGTLTISDVDSPASFAAQTETAGNYGRFSIGTDGAWTFTADSAHNEFAAGTSYMDTFAVAAADGTATSVTINILGTNDGPVAVADAAATTENAPVTRDVIGNDTDVDETDVLSLTAGSAAISTMTLDSDGSAITESTASVSQSGNRITFDPGTDFDLLAAGDTATVVIDYTVQDDHTPPAEDTGGTLTVTVTGVDDQVVGQGFFLCTVADGTAADDTRDITAGDTLYIHLYSDTVDFTNMKQTEYKLQDANKRRIKGALTNQGNGTFTAVVTPNDLSRLAPGTVKVTLKLEDNAGTKYQAKNVRITLAAALQAGSELIDGPGHDERLTPVALQPLVQEAIGLWRYVGADPAVFGGLSVRVADLPGPYLGLATRNEVLIDADAAGYGWFVDQTPWEDSEFTQPGDQGEQGRIDLLTTVVHELGHVLGLDDLDPVGHSDELMAAVLPTGIRRLPETEGRGHGAEGIGAEGRGQKTEDRGQRIEDRGQRTEDRGQRTEDRGQRTENRGPRIEDGGQRTEDRGHRAEDRGQRTEDRKQRIENRGSRAESGWRFSEFVAPIGLFPNKVTGEAEKAQENFAGGGNAKGIKEVEKFRDGVDKPAKKGGVPATVAKGFLDAADQVIATAADAAAAQQSRQSISDNAESPEDVRLDPDNTPAAGSGDNHLIDWRRKPEDWQHIELHNGSGWVKPFVSDFRPDDPNKDIKIVLADLVE